uniref:hypothetical protein n=1 Tax=Prevotella sp. TaxID=59823 RepID=UPI004026BEF6
MNEGVLLLKEVAKLKDIVSLGVCVSIFQTCNGKQFKNMPADTQICSIMKDGDVASFYSSLE